ncbi:MAG: hypothetical protein ACLT5P_15490 [Flavonifractor plautii]
MERITSRQNPLITRLRRLGAEKKTRRAQGVFLCEGTKLVGEALRWGPPPELLAVAEGTAPPAELPAGVRVVEVPEALRGRCPPWVPQGMLACAGRRTQLRRRRCRGPPAGAGRGAGPRQRGHRLAHRRRLQAAGLFLLPGCASPCPQTVRATMGACAACGVGGDAGGPDLPAGPVGRLPVRRLRTTRRTSAPSRWRAPPWSSAARGGGCPSRCWTPAGRL